MLAQIPEDPAEVHAAKENRKKIETLYAAVGRVPPWDGNVSKC